MTKLYKIFSILIIVLLLSSALYAQDNPFIKKKTPAKKTQKVSRYPQFIQNFLNKINKVQREINKKLTQLGRELKESKSRKTFFILILFAFLYGVIHAVGPGHGKVLTFSYFLTKSANIKKGFLLGFLIAFFHAFTALVIVLGIYFLIKKSYMTNVENVSQVLRLVSYGAITALGLFLLIKGIIELRKKDEQEESPDSFKNKNLLPLALAVGLVPCPGAVLILLFSISMEIIKVGMVLAIFYSLGMGVTISTVGALTILTRTGVVKSFEANEGVQNFIHHGIELMGAVLILIIGALLLTSTL